MIPVILAADGLRSEVDLVARASSAGLQIVRRPVDAVELLAAASCDRTMAVVISASLPRITGDVVQRLLADDRPVIGLHSDATTQSALRSLGIHHLVSALGDPTEVIQAVATSLQRLAESVASRDRSWDLGVTGTSPGRLTASPDGHRQRGRIVAVCGSPGAPGRSVTAIGLSEAFAAEGRRTCTVDADLQAPSIGLQVGVREDVSGLVVACRLTEHGSLDPRSIMQAARAMSPQWSILSGISRAEDWSYVRPDCLRSVLERCREAFEVTVVDLGAELPGDDVDLLSSDRGLAVGAVLEVADEALAVARADALGVARLVQAWPRLRALMTGTGVRVVLTHVDRGSSRSIRSALANAGIGVPVHLVPRDVRAFSRCLAKAATLGEVARRSNARAAMHSLARAVGADLDAIHDGDGWAIPA